jgi:hypothetical protein
MNIIIIIFLIFIIISILIYYNYYLIENFQTNTNGNITYDQENAQLICNTSTLIPEDIQNTINGVTDIFDVVIGPNVQTIANDCFFNLKNIRNLIFSESTLSNRNIGMRAFAQSSIGSQIIIPNNFTNIELSAFTTCSNITEFRFPNSITDIKRTVLSKCAELRKVYLPNTITNIGTSAFGWGNKKLNEFIFYGRETEINIFPSNLVNIQNNVFRETLIETISLENTKISYLNAGIFYNCANLSNIILPNTVTRIRDSSFEKCSSLTNINFLPDNVTIIDQRAFNSCSNIRNILFPENLEIIGTRAFQNCSKIETITFNKKLITINLQAFYQCFLLREAIFKQNLKEIGEGCFYNCKELKKVVLPYSLETLGNSAFKSCNIININIPETILNFGTDVFMNTNIVPELGTIVSNGVKITCPSLLNLTVSGYNGNYYVSDFSNNCPVWRHDIIDSMNYVEIIFCKQYYTRTY